MDCLARSTNSSSVGSGCMMAFRSADAVTTLLPSGLNDALETVCVAWLPFRTAANRTAPDTSDTSQTRTSSLVSVATHLPSGLNDALSMTEFVCPPNTTPTHTHSPPGPWDWCQIRAVWSWDAVTTRWPSGLNDAS